MESAMSLLQAWRHVNLYGAVEVHLSENRVSRKASILRGRQGKRKRSIELRSGRFVNIRDQEV